MCEWRGEGREGRGGRGRGKEGKKERETKWRMEIGKRKEKWNGREEGGRERGGRKGERREEWREEGRMERGGRKGERREEWERGRRDGRGEKRGGVRTHTGTVSLLHIMCEGSEYMRSMRVTPRTYSLRACVASRSLSSSPLTRASFFPVYAPMAWFTERGMREANKSTKLGAGEDNWTGFARAAFPGGSRVPKSGTRSL